MELICKQTRGIVNAEGELAKMLIASGSFEKKPTAKRKSKEKK